MPYVADLCIIRKIGKRERVRGIMSLGVWGRRYTCIESQADIKRKRSKRLIVGNNKTKKGK
jgi:hypothetical protein